MEEEDINSDEFIFNRSLRMTKFKMKLIVLLYAFAKKDVDVDVELLGPIEMILRVSWA